MEKTKKKLERRCPRLGGPVPFHYCKMSGDHQLPCFKIVDCWWETFDIVQYLKDNLPEDHFNRLMDARPRPKISSLVELIEQAKNRKG
jgi:glutathione S-transferase